MPCILEVAEYLSTSISFARKQFIRLWSTNFAENFLLYGTLGVILFSITLPEITNIAIIQSETFPHELGSSSPFEAFYKYIYIYIYIYLYMYVRD